MKYLILIHSNPKSRAVWDGLSDEQKMEFGRTHLALTRELTASGDLVASAGLDDPSTARWVSARDGRTLSSDGPYAEAKEYLAGFYLVECDTIEQAVELAARVPDAASGEVEVRPVLDLESLVS